MTSQADATRLFVNFEDRDPSGRIRIHDVFQPLGALPETRMADGQRVLLDDERGDVRAGILVLDDFYGGWRAELLDEALAART